MTTKSLQLSQNFFWKSFSNSNLYSAQVVVAYVTSVIPNSITVESDNTLTFVFVTALRSSLDTQSAVRNVNLSLLIN
jgi:hypothetical protein